MAKLLLNGSPGEVYTNTGDRILYQFHCQFGHSCGVCISYHMSIGTSFPIPLHRGCNCTQTPIFPGQSGEPFVDFREMIREMGPAEQAAVMGRSNLQLVESGVVKYEDVVTKTRVRDLREVVSRGKLTVEEMVDAGVGRRQAERAYETVHTPAHELADAKRRELIDALRGKGIADDAIRRAVSERIALRIGIGEGPSGEGGLSIFPTTPKPTGPVESEKPKPPPKPRVKKPKPPPPAPKPAPAPKPPPEKVAAPAGVDPLSIARAEQRARNRELALKAGDRQYADSLSRFPDRLPEGTIQDRIKAYTLGDAKVRAVVEIGSKYEAVERELAAERTRLGQEFPAVMRRQAELEREASRGGKLPAKKAAELEDLSRRFEELKGRRDQVLERQTKLADDRRAELEAVFKVEKGVKFRADDVPPGFQGVQGDRLVPLSDATRSNHDKALTWLQSNVAAGDLSEIDLKIGQAPGIRPHYYDGRRYIQVAEGESVGLIVHEYGHLTDYQMETMGVVNNARAQEFLKYRVGDEQPVDMNAKFGGGNPGEMGRKDKFDSVYDEYEAYYVGKDNNTGGRSSEVYTMGVQLMYNDPVKFAKDDPEYFKFVAGMMDGSLR